MTFLNLALLFGIAAATVPLIIHLLHRTKVRVIHWGAMQFLAGAIAKRSRRLQWQQWLLLAIRCAIPALLALAMAQPALTWINNRIGGNDSAQQFILIDNSLSMLATKQTTSDRVGQASLKDIVAGIENAITRPKIWNEQSSQAQSLAIANGSIEEQVAEQFNRQPVDIVNQLRVALEQTEPDENTGNKPNFVLVSDCRLAQLDALSPDRKRQIRSLLNNSPGAKIYLLPVLPLTDQVQSIDNVAVHIDDSSDSIVGPHQVSEIDFTVGNFGSQPIQDLVIDIRMQGKTQATLRIDLIAGQIERRTIQVPALARGDYVLEIVCDRNDAFAYDNRAYWTLQAIAPEKVLIIHGPTVSSSNYMQFAIFPPSMTDAATTQEQVHLPRQFEILGPVKFDNQSDLMKQLEAKPQHVILCDVPRLNDDLLNRIKDSTQSGTLMLLAGKSADVDWWNKKLFQDALKLPIQIESKQRNNNAATSIRFVRTAQLSLTSEMLSSLKSDESTVNAQSYWQLKLLDDQMPATDDSTTAPDQLKMSHAVDVFATHENTPMLITGNVDHRQYLLSAFDFHPDESNLPLSEVFLPLIQSFYQSHLRTKLDCRNLTSGEELPSSIPIDDEQTSRIDLTWQKGLVLYEQVANKFKNGTQIESTPHSVAPGVYSSIVKRNDTDFEVHYATVQTPWSESALQVASRESVLNFANDIGAKLFEPDLVNSVANTSTDADASNESRWNVWRYFLLLLLIFLFAELLMQRHLARSLA